MFEPSSGRIAIEPRGSKLGLRANLPLDSVLRDMHSDADDVRFECHCERGEQNAARQRGDELCRGASRWSTTQTLRAFPVKHVCNQKPLDLETVTRASAKLHVRTGRRRTAPTPPTNKALGRDVDNFAGNNQN